MEIKFKSSESLDKRSMYIHTRGRAISLKDVEDGTILDPLEIVVYTDMNSKGEEQTITSVITTDGKHYATNSRFFREELGNIFNLFAPEPFKVKVCKEISKGGRTFITCELV